MYVYDIMREPGHIGRAPAPNNVSALVLFLFFFLANIFGIDLFIHGAYLRCNNNNNNIYNSVAFYLHSAGPLQRCPAATTSGDIIPKPVPPEPMTFNAFMTAARDCTGRTYTAAVVRDMGVRRGRRHQHCAVTVAGAADVVMTRLQVVVIAITPLPSPARRTVVSRRRLVSIYRYYDDAIAECPDRRPRCII